MTHLESYNLARRAVACKGWRWMPGMRALYGGDAWFRLREGDARPPNPRSAFPDLDDPATLGCLLTLVREAWDEPRLCVEIRQPGDLGCRACVMVPIGSEGWRTIQWWCASQNLQHAEAKALVAALEAAPC